MAARQQIVTRAQSSQFESSWSAREILRTWLWKVVWLLLCRWTPKFAMRWRAFVLRLFGCRINGVVFVSQSAKIWAPWRLTLEDRSCIGPESEVYNLGTVILHARATVAQHVYLCGGSHDFGHPNLPLVTGDIELGRDSFVGAKALLLLGVSIGEGAVVGAGAVVSKDVPPWTIWAGNPARQLGTRESRTGE